MQAPFRCLGSLDRPSSRVENGVIADREVVGGRCHPVVGDIVDQLVLHQAVVAGATKTGAVASGVVDHITVGAQIEGACPGVAIDTDTAKVQQRPCAPWSQPAAIATGPATTAGVPPRIFDLADKCHHGIHAIDCHPK